MRNEGLRMMDGEEEGVSHTEPCKCSTGIQYSTVQCNCTVGTIIINIYV